MRSRPGLFVTELVNCCRYSIVSGVIFVTSQLHNFHRCNTVNDLTNPIKTTKSLKAILPPTRDLLPQLLKDERTHRVIQMREHI